MQIKFYCPQHNYRWSAAISFHHSFPNRTHNIDLILALTGGFVAALTLGYITHRIGISPIIGYLLAGIAVSLHTPTGHISVGWLVMEDLFVCWCFCPQFSAPPPPEEKFN